MPVFKMYKDLKGFNDAIPQPVKNPDVHSVTFKQDYFDYVALSVIIVLSMNLFIYFFY